MNASPRQRPLLQAAIVLQLVMTSPTMAIPNETEWQRLEVSVCKGQPDCVEAMMSTETTRLLYDMQALKVRRDRVVLEEYERLADHRVATLNAQYVANWIVLAVVIAIVGSGLAMSWMQLRKNLGDGTTTQNTLELGKAGFKMKSPVIGLIIFVVSTYFFGVYVDKIYTITPLPARTDEKVKDTKEALARPLREQQDLRAAVGKDTTQPAQPGK